MKRGRGGGLGLSRKGKKVINSNQRLLTISDKDREILLSERVLNILDSAQKSDEYKILFETERNEFEEIPEELKQYQIQERTLWNQAGRLCELPEEAALLNRLLESNKIKHVYVPQPEILPEVDSKKSQKSVLKTEKSYVISKYFERTKKSADVVPSKISEIDDSECDSDVSLVATPCSSKSIGNQKTFYPIFEKTLSQIESKKSKYQSSQASQSQDSSFLDFETKAGPSISSSTSNSMPMKSEKMGFFSKFETEKKPVVDSSDHKDLGADFLRLFLENIDTNITLYGREEKPIKAHKVILKVRCPKLLRDVVDEKRPFGKSREVIALTCFSHVAVKCMISYIYCGKIVPPGFDFPVLSEKDLEEIKELGKKYGLDLECPVGDRSNGEASAVSSPVTKKIIQETFVQTEVLQLLDSSTQTEVPIVELKERDPSPARNGFGPPYGSSTPEKFSERSTDFLSRNQNGNGYDSDSDVRSASPDFFDEPDKGFNDKTFKNASLNKSEHRTWNERSFKPKPPEEFGDDDDDCIILLDEEDFEEPPLLTSDKKDEKGEEEEELPSVENSPCWKNAMEDKTPAIPMNSIWNKTYDDQFFANLPSDEDLLNFPPTSPSGAKTFNCSTSNLPSVAPKSPLYPLPSSPVRLLDLPGAASKKAATKRKAKKSFDDLVDIQQPSKKLNKEHKHKNGGHGSSSNFRDDNMQFETEESDSLPSSSQPSDIDMYRTPKASTQASQQLKNRKNKTPMLNYSLIDTPILKKELKRYGLKPLPRSKAKKILRHIYTETHRE